MGGNVIAQLSSVVGTVTSTFSYDAPVISDTPQDNLASTAGVSITLQGTNFGLKTATMSARLGGSACATVSFVSTTSLGCFFDKDGHESRQKADDG